MATALCLDLILNVQSCDPRTCVLGDGAGDHGRSTEAGICVRDDGDSGIETTHHLGALNEIIQSGNGQVGLTETRCSSSCTTVGAMRQVREQLLGVNRKNLW